MDNFRFADMLIKEGESLEPYIAAAYLLHVSLERGGSPAEVEPRPVGLAEVYEHRNEFGLDERILSFIEQALSGCELDGRFFAELSYSSAGKLLVLARELCERERQSAEGDWVPESLAELLLRLMTSGGTHDRLASLGCGTGRLASELLGRFDSVALWDEDGDLAVMAAVMLELANGIGRIVLLDDPASAQPGKFDCVTVVLSPSCSSAKHRARSVSDWQRCAEVVDLLAPDGKAVVLLSLSSLNNKASQRERAEFLYSSRSIRAIVALPQACMTSLRSPTLVLLDKSAEHGAIRMVDATGFGKKGRGGCPFSFSNREMDEIAGLIEGDASGNKHAKGVEVSSLHESGWRLDPPYYLDEVVAVTDGVRLGDIVEVNRGISNLDKKLLSAEEGGESVSYLEIGAIEDGEINLNKVEPVFLDPWGARDCGKNSANCGDIVVSKAGPNFKVALVDDCPGRQPILASSNFYILRVRGGEPDDSMYLRAFFDSEKSWGQIRRLAAGSGRIKALSVKALKELRVPWPSSEEREEVARAYKEKRDRLRKLKAEMKACRKEMGSLFDEDGRAESGEEDV